MESTSSCHRQTYTIPVQYRFSNQVSPFTKPKKKEFFRSIFSFTAIEVCESFSQRGVADFSVFELEESVP